MKTLVFSLLLSAICLQSLELNTHFYERDTNRGYFNVLWQIASITIFQQEVKAKESQEIALTKKVIAYFFEDDFEKVTPLFNDKMKEALPVEQMKTVKKTLQSQVGEFKGTSRASENEHEQYKIVEVLCQFTGGNLICRTTFDKDAKIAGWYFLPEK